jgi:hypothetical protein
MDRKLIPFLAFALLLAASGCSEQPAYAPPYQPAVGNPCLPPGPCNFPGGGNGLSPLSSKQL